MARAPVTPRRFGDADPHFLAQKGRATAPRKEQRPLPADGPSVDARTAELRERIAASSRIAVIGSLLLRR